MILSIFVSSDEQDYNAMNHYNIEIKQMQDLIEKASSLLEQLSWSDWPNRDPKNT